MPTAPSFQKMEIIGEPFVLDKGRQYVNVKNPNTGKLRQVRWYTDIEYAKLYPAVEPAVPRSADPYAKPQKEVLGFTKGYITIFKGDQEPHNDWFRASIARYTRWWGWYIISTEEVPEDLPFGLSPVRLDWSLVGTENGKLKIEKEVKEGVESVLYADATGEFVGSIGDRIEIDVVVEKAIELETNFGNSTMYIMSSGDNRFIWTTSAKQWPVGTEHHIRGTIKDHRKYKGENQNILTRCVER